MMEEREIETQSKLYRAKVGPSNAPDLLLFRAPTILDASGYHKRLPHQIDWQHVQMGDLLIAIEMDQRGGALTIHSLRIMDVVDQLDKETFDVWFTDIVITGASGATVYNR